MFKTVVDHFVMETKNTIGRPVEFTEIEDLITVIMY